MPYEEFLVTEDLLEKDAQETARILQRWKGKTGSIKFFSHHDPMIMNTPPTIRISDELVDLLKLVFENKIMTSLIQKRQLFCRIQSGFKRDQHAEKALVKMALKFPTLSFLYAAGNRRVFALDHLIWIFWKGDSDLTLEIETPWGEAVNEHNRFGRNNVQWSGRTVENFWRTAHCETIHWENPNPGRFNVKISNRSERDDGFRTTKYEVFVLEKGAELRFIPGKIKPGETKIVAEIDSPNIIDGVYHPPPQNQPSSQ